MCIRRSFVVQPAQAPTIGKCVKRAPQPRLARERRAHRSSSCGSTARTAPQPLAHRGTRALAAGQRVQPGAVAEVDVADDAELLERVEVAVDRREVRAAAAARRARRRSLGGHRPSAVNSASSDQRRAWTRAGRGAHGGDRST